MDSEASWDKVAALVSAGNIDGIVVSPDMQEAKISIVQSTAYQDGSRDEWEIHLTCRDCRYLAIRRTEGGEPGESSILEASLQRGSRLVQRIYAHELDSKLGPLASEVATASNGYLHLELVGPTSVNIVCADVAVMVKEMLPREVEPTHGV